MAKINSGPVNLSCVYWDIETYFMVTDKVFKLHIRKYDLKDRNIEIKELKIAIICRYTVSWIDTSILKNVTYNVQIRSYEMERYYIFVLYEVCPLNEWKPILEKKHFCKENDNNENTARTMPWACWALTRFIALAELNGNRIWHLIASSILAFRRLKNSWLFFFRDGGTTSMINTRPRGPRSKLSPLYYLNKIEVIYPIKRAKIKLNIVKQ